MKSLFINIKNLLPYLLLISIYFIFVNIEARNDQNIIHKKRKSIENNTVNDVSKSNINDYKQRIAIPVIPYNP